MITGILIPHDDEQPIKVVQVDAEDVPTMQGIVEGSFEVHNFDAPAGSIFSNDEAMLWSLPHNHRATILLWQHAKELRGHVYIAGNALLAGMPDGRGCTKSAPAELVKLLTETQSYRVELLHDPKGAWRPDRTPFDNWVDAYNHALITERTFATVKSARVVGA
ncbi:DUF3846 domain-containing protein [Streptomyces cinereoruber]|uniref:DUF3846 domain-containing protein n=1 Tax=Streptomyces cinereoruber TaxID=67260 RepID=UPI003639C407